MKKYNALNNIGYLGKVKIKLKTKNGIHTIETHNNGTDYFFRTLLMALKGNNVVNRIPVKCTLIKASNTEPKIEDDTTLYTKFYIPVTGARIATDISNNPYLINTITISKDQLANLSTASDNLFLCITDYTGTNILVYIPVKKEIFTNLGQDTSIIIEWELHFENSPNNESWTPLPSSDTPNDNDNTENTENEEE